MKANTCNSKPDNKHYLEWVQLQYSPTGSDEDFETTPASSAVNAFKVTESRTLDVSGTCIPKCNSGYTHRYSFCDPIMEQDSHGRETSEHVECDFPPSDHIGGRSNARLP
jgi:hypothetical protein